MSRVCQHVGEGRICQVKPSFCFNVGNGDPLRYACGRHINIMLVQLHRERAAHVVGHMMNVRYIGDDPPTP